MSEWTKSKGPSIGALTSALRQHPGATQADIIHLLGLPDNPESTTSIAEQLYSHPERFDWRDGLRGRHWFDVASIGTSSLATGALADPGTPVSLQLELYPWQRRALAAWRSRGSRGVVEAVTGAGKTRLALQAILETLGGGGKAAVVVPTLELVRQWRREIDRFVVPRIARPLLIGVLGGGARGDLLHFDVLVMTAASAAQTELSDPGPLGLLVADECHHYGAEVWSLSLDEAFEQRLGLTATYEREDHGLREWLDPYFGGVSYRVGYREALREEVIAHFRLAFVGARLSPTEKHAYDKASEDAHKYRQRLIRDWEVPARAFWGIPEGPSDPTT